jgi:uncharacterized membrane protein YhaH (DUF805 family)
MSFAEAVRTVLSKYAVFAGRARRSEYWWYTLFSLIVSIVVSIIDKAIGNPVLELLVSLALLLPTLGVSIRRLHDTGRSGWWLFIVLIPIVGWIVLIVFYCQDSQPGQNSYGPSPKGAGPIQADPGYPTQYGS